jgi:hypothetical protein
MILRPGCKDARAAREAAALAIITVMTLANYSLSVCPGWLGCETCCRSSARLIMIDLICSQFRFLREQ